jgi:hypothetical protein
MITLRFNARALEWRATATFPYKNDSKYNEYDYTGYGSTPELATIDLLERLATERYPYYYTYYADAHTTDYKPVITYNRHHELWQCEVKFASANPFGSSDTLAARADSPDVAHTAALLALTAETLHIPRSQSRTAETLFTLL